MKSRGSVLLRVAAGFAAGSAVGWVAHDRHQTFHSLFGRNDNNQTEEYGVGRVWSFSETANSKPSPPSVLWDKNWDKYVTVFA